MGLMGFDCNFDVVLVVDSSGGMGAFWEDFRAFAPRFYETFLHESHIMPSNLRVRLVDFSDFATEGDQAIAETPFFNLPQENDDFVAAVNAVQTENRGGDIPENALEALWLGLKSDWTPRLEVSGPLRHFVVLITDAPPLKLQERDICLGYDGSAYPSSVLEMQKYWDGMQNYADSTRYDGPGRLLAFVPKEGWEHVGLENWKGASIFPVKQCQGLSDYSWEEIVKIIGQCR